jgi:hypothetical protein
VIQEKRSISHRWEKLVGVVCEASVL